MALRAVNFRAPFKEQVAFFRNKIGNLLPTSAWDDIKKSEHDRAFVVAGAVKGDLLADLASAIDKAIADGETIEQFRARFADIVKTHGWHGWTGEGTDKGVAWRTRVIYETNLSTSYAAGRLAQLREAGHKFWVYKHADGVAHPRPQHLAWDGLVLPADHPFWEQHYPPNGWGCRCRVLGAAGPNTAKLVGGDPAKKLLDGWDEISPKTGEMVGIDKGWGYRPGDTVTDTVRALVPKLDNLPREVSIGVIQDWLKTSAFDDWYQSPTGDWPLVVLSDADAALLNAETTTAKISRMTAEKQKREHPEISANEYAAAQKVVDKPTAFSVQDNIDKQGEKTGTKSLVYVLNEQDSISGGYVLVVKATASGKGLWITSYRRLPHDEAMRDSEIVRVLAGASRK